MKQYITPTYATFASEWDKLANASSETETFALSTSESIRGESRVEGYEGSSFQTRVNPLSKCLVWKRLAGRSRPRPTLCIRSI